MIKKFVKYGKFREYLLFDFENVFGYLGTLLIVVVSIIVGMNEHFNAYIDLINSFVGVIIGAFIGALALVLTGIIFWGSLLDSDYVQMICSATKDEEAVDKLYTSYLFLAFNMICYVVIAVCCLLFINSFFPIINKWVFYFIEILFVYFFLFNIGYMVSILRNCIRLIQIRNEKNLKEEKTLYERANELRIDIIYELLYRKMNPEEMHDDLMKIINRRIEMMEIEIEDKMKLKDYLEEYYKLDK